MDSVAGAVLPGGLSHEHVLLHVQCARLMEVNALLCDPGADADALRAERARLTAALVAHLRRADAGAAAALVAPWRARHVFGAHAAREGLASAPRAVAPAADPLRLFPDADTRAAFPLAGPSVHVRLSPALGPMGGFRAHVKMAIPAGALPAKNFVGLLLGPRGQTLRRVEAEARGVRIGIRGRGSLRDAGARGAEGDEPLHAVVMYDEPEAADRALRMLARIIDTAARTPAEESNELKRTQLRALAVLNGTIRPEEMVVCGACGEEGHRRFECTAGPRRPASVVACGACGVQGHVASDCRAPSRSGEAGHAPGASDAPPPPAPTRQRLESAYAALMADLEGDL